MPEIDRPYQYFGGKSMIAAEVWRRFGDVGNYVEPFYGGGAVHLLRPHRFDDGVTRVETINDLDAYVANFWRAVQRDPNAVADLLDWPVNEADLEARHKWLVTAVRKREHHERMRDDPDYCDVKIAAWWCWGLCAWIGGGWCGGEWHGRGHEDSHGQGTHSGDCALRPHLGNAGRGVHRQRPHLNAGQGECARRNANMRAYMQQLCDRLRNVRVCCGDWSRVCTYTPTTYLGLTGVFLDPPYLAETPDGKTRTAELYRCEDTEVAHAVREWAIEAGKNRMMRIALCGYEGEHDMPADWECMPWKAQGGMGMQNGEGDYENKHRERVWFSPGCIREKGLFDGTD